MLAELVSIEGVLLTGFGIMCISAIAVLILLLRSPRFEPKESRNKQLIGVAKDNLNPDEYVYLHVPKTCFVFNRLEDKTLGRWTCVCPGLMLEADNPEKTFGVGQSLYEAYRDHLRKI